MTGELTAPTSIMSTHLHLEAGARVTIVPDPQMNQLMLTLGRRHGGGAVFATMPESVAAVLLSKLTAYFLAKEDPRPLMVDDFVTAGDAGRGVLAGLRAKREAAGAELTAGADDFTPAPLSSMGSPSLAAALSNLGPDATPEQIQAALAGAMALPAPSPDHGVAVEASELGAALAAGKVVELHSRRRL